MAITTRKTRTGRIIIEKDGYISKNWQEVGQVVCKISVPADSDIERVIYNLPDCPNAGPDYIDAIREAIPGVRVYEWRKVL